MANVEEKNVVQFGPDYVRCGFIYTAKSDVKKLFRRFFRARLLSTYYRGHNIAIVREVKYYSDGSIRVGCTRFDPETVQQVKEWVKQ